jgi:hypothetical protein
MASRTIHVRAYDRTMGTAYPKWILINMPGHGLGRALVDIRKARWTDDLGQAKLYFRNRLKRFCKEQYGEDWEDNPNLILLAVR